MLTFFACLLFSLIVGAIGTLLLAWCVKCYGRWEYRRNYTKRRPGRTPIQRLSDAELHTHARLLASGEADEIIYHPESDTWEPVLNR